MKGSESLASQLSFFRRLQLRLQGYAFLKWEKREGWSDYLPIYVVRCKRHGLFLDYPHGYEGYFLCPRCREELLLEYQKDSFLSQNFEEGNLICAHVRALPQTALNEPEQKKTKMNSDNLFSANFDIKSCKNKKIYQKDAIFDINISKMISKYQKLHLRQKFYPSYNKRSQKKAELVFFSLFLHWLAGGSVRAYAHIGFYDFRNVTQVTLGGAL